MTVRDMHRVASTKRHGDGNHIAAERHKCSNVACVCVCVFVCVSVYVCLRVRSGVWRRPGGWPTPFHVRACVACACVGV